MAAGQSVDHDGLGWLQDRLQSASPDLLREMVKTFGDMCRSLSRRDVRDVTARLVSPLSVPRL